MTMARNVDKSAEETDNEDRRMNAYMAGLRTQVSDTDDEGGEVEEDEVEASHFRRQRARARRAEY